MYLTCKRMLVFSMLMICLSGGSIFAMTLEEALEALPSYEFADDDQIPTSIEVAVKEITAGKGDRATLSSKLVAVLKNDEATVTAKRFVCRQLYLIGGDEAVEALAELLTDKELSHMARYVLGRMVSDKAGAALRDALERSEGSLRVGLINTIGQRHDVKAIDAIAEHTAADDLEVQTAAFAALGEIGGADVAARLVALSKSIPESDVMRLAAIDAMLQCAEGENRAGRTASANALFNTIESMHPPKSLHLAVLRGRLRIADSDDVPLLLKMLGSEDIDQRGVAMSYMNEAAKPETITTVLVKGDSLSPDGQVIAIESAAIRRIAQARPHVLQYARQSKSEPRQAAIMALSKLGTLEDLP